MNYDTLSHNFGAEVLARQHSLKTDLDTKGEAGLTSLIKAMIWSGIAKHDDIVARIQQITGSHVTRTLDLLLKWGIGLHWESHDGNYTPCVSMPVDLEY